MGIRLTLAELLLSHSYHKIHGAMSAKFLFAVCLILATLAIFAEATTTTLKPTTTTGKPGPTTTTVHHHYSRRLPPPDLRRAPLRHPGLSLQLTRLQHTFVHTNIHVCMYMPWRM